MELIMLVLKDIQPGRFVESMIFLGVLILRIKPYLKKFDDRLAGLATVVETGFKSGESRFQKIEDRLTAVEKKEPTEGQHEKDRIN